MMSAYPATSAGMLGASPYHPDGQAQFTSRRSSLSSGSVHSRGSETSDKLYEHAHAQHMRAAPLVNLALNTAAANQAPVYPSLVSPTTPHARHAASQRRDKHRMRDDEREANLRAAKIERVRRTLGDGVPDDLVVPPGAELASKQRSHAHHRRSKTVTATASNASYFHPANELRPPLPGIFEAPLPSEIDRHRSKKDRDDEEALLKSKRRMDKEKGMHAAIGYGPIGSK